MKCNIDARGRVMRLAAGIILLCGGVLTGALQLVGIVRSDWFLLPALVLVLSGAFAIVQGWAGWCAFRAMGFRTRL